ncbi:MAG: hypothetical protein WKF70_12855, partial [Chitinophagaceae bacterium]
LCLHFPYKANKGWRLNMNQLNVRCFLIIFLCSFSASWGSEILSMQGDVMDFTSLHQNNNQLPVYYPHGARMDNPSADTIPAVVANSKSVQLKVIRYSTAFNPY